MSFKLKITTNNKNVVTETGTPVVPENNNIFKCHIKLSFQ